MLKENLLLIKEAEWERIKSEIRIIKFIELKKVYKLEGRAQECYGYFECFNKESACFVVIASDSIGMYEKHSYQMGQKTYSHRGNLISVDYSTAYKFTPVKRGDLPLLIGLKFKSIAFENLLKGKSHLKMED